MCLINTMYALSSQTPDSKAKARYMATVCAKNKNYGVGYGSTGKKAKEDAGESLSNGMTIWDKLNFILSFVYNLFSKTHFYTVCIQFGNFLSLLC